MLLDKKLREFGDESDSGFSTFINKCEIAKLNPQQILYCLHYSTPDDRSFRSQKYSYMKAYGKTEADYQPVSASILHKKQKIKKGIRLAEQYLSPSFYDKLMLYKEHWDMYQECKESDVKSAIRLLELMGKSIGLYDGKAIQEETTGVDNAKKAFNTNFKLAVNNTEEKKVK